MGKTSFLSIYKVDHLYFMDFFCACITIFCFLNVGDVVVAKSFVSEEQK